MTSLLENPLKSLIKKSWSLIGIEKSGLVGCLVAITWDTFPLLVNKVTCMEYKVGEKVGKGFGCPSKKEEECVLLFGVGSKQGRLDLILPNF